MTGKSHLISAATCAICADAGLKLISEIFGRQTLFASYREYITSGLLRVKPEPQIASEALASFSQTAQPQGVLLLALTVTGVIFLFFGSLLPDIDSKKSLLGRFIYVPVKHRTFTHSLFLFCRS